MTCARANAGVVLPGYTHLQRAQPILLGHHLAAHAWMLERDAERLRAAYAAADECPLGAGALAGSSLPLDPQWTAAQLGFARSFDNTIDAVADRDFICDLLYACALGFVHLSRLAEEVIIFTSQEFAFAQLDDTVALGSSIMPQKKNPQIAEHLRGRSGVAIGRLAAMLAVCKGLPLAYDSDLQEDKELAFAQVAAFDGRARARRRCSSAGLHFDAERMRAAAADGATVATDVAEALVRGGHAVPRGARAGRVAHRRRRALRRADARAGRRGAQRAGRHLAGARRRAARGADVAGRGDARLGAVVTAARLAVAVDRGRPRRRPRDRRRRGRGARAALRHAALRLRRRDAARARPGLPGRRRRATRTPTSRSPARPAAPSACCACSASAASAPTSRARASSPRPCARASTRPHRRPRQRQDRRRHRCRDRGRLQPRRARRPRRGRARRGRGASATGAARPSRCASRRASSPAATRRSRRPTTARSSASRRPRPRASATRRAPIREPRLARPARAPRLARSTIRACSRASCAGSARSATSTRSSRA